MICTGAFRLTRDAFLHSPLGFNLNFGTQEYRKKHLTSARVSSDQT